MTLPRLSPNQIENIAQILGDTGNGFTGSEIGHHLAQCRIADPDPTITKWKRLYNAFAAAVNGTGFTNAVYQFIQHCMEPAQGLQKPGRYNWLKVELNRVLMLVNDKITESVEAGKRYDSQGKRTSIPVAMNKVMRVLKKGNIYGKFRYCCIYSE